MHICIVGTGASGWMAAHSLHQLPNIKKVTIVGSDKIPTIGVGESTTLNFMAFIRDTFGYDLNRPCKHFMKFLVDIDAALKYGVYYENWAEQSFLHEFCNMSASVMNQERLLGAKPKGEPVNEYISDMTKYVFNNHIYFRPYNKLDGNDTMPCSVHFDANMFIRTLQEKAKEAEKIEHLVGTAIDLIYEGEISNITQEEIQFVIDTYDLEGEQLNEFLGALLRLGARAAGKLAKPIGRAITNVVDRTIDNTVAKAATKTVAKGASKIKAPKITYDIKPSNVKYGGGATPKPTQPTLSRSQAQRALDDDPWTRGAISRDDVMRARQDRRALNNEYEYSNWRSDFGLSEDWQKVNRQEIGRAHV